jgi:hypothetical protein
MSIALMQKEEVKKENSCPLKVLAYLPREGLQGEDIPSHALWKNAKVRSIEVSFCHPLKFKEVFNAESWKVQDNKVIVEKVELDGYIGLTFGSSKVSELEVVAPVEYLINLVDGGMIKEVKEIRLFRPQLNLEIQKKTITIIPKTRYIKDRIKIKNIGRGTLMIYVSTEKDSPAQLEIPHENREFAEKFLSDLLEELSKVAKDFPQLEVFLDYVAKWDTKNALSVSDEERAQITEYSNRTAKLLASNRDLLEGFMSAYGRALARNSEFIEVIRRAVNLYESLLSKDILLINPFDEIAVNGKVDAILKISQTDKVLDHYDDIPLPVIELISSEGVRVPIHKLFEWR